MWTGIRLKSPVMTGRRRRLASLHVNFCDSLLLSFLRGNRQAFCLSKLFIDRACVCGVCALALRTLWRKWTNYSPRWSGHEGQLLNWLMLLACSLLSGEKWSTGRSVLTTHAATVYVCPCVLIFVLRFTFFVSPPARLQMWKKSQFISNTRKHAERLQQCWLVTACDKNIKVCAYHADDLVWCFMLTL